MDMYRYVIYIDRYIDRWMDIDEYRYRLIQIYINRYKKIDIDPDPPAERLYGHDSDVLIDVYIER